MSQSDHIDTLASMIVPVKNLLDILFWYLRAL